MLPIVVFLLCQAPRLAPPTPEEQKEKEKLIREVFKTEYAKKTSAQQIDLAQMLLQQASESKDDPGSRFVLLREARDLAAGAGDPGTALRAIGRMAALFEIDAPRMKLAALTLAGQGTRAADGPRQVAEAFLALVDEAGEAEDLETQEKAAALAALVARKAKDVPLVTRADARVKEVAQQKTKLSRVKAALEVLSKDPEDPAAHLEVGQYWCFQKGNWEEGLPHLAKGSAGPLKSLAERDLSLPTPAQEQASLGDSWKELADREPASGSRIRDRALFWYQQALPGSQGLLKLKLEKRMGELLQGRTPAARARERGPLAEGLVGWWTLDEGSGTVANDDSGQGNSGKLQGGVQWVPGHAGKALRFNGTDGQVLVEDTPSLRIVGDFTVACWVRREGNSKDWARLVGKGTRDARQFGLWVGTTHQDNHWMFQQWDQEKHELVALNSKSACENGKWFHVAAVVRGDQAFLYVNGVEEDSRKRGGTPATSADPLTFGYPNWDYPFLGVLDDIRLYKRGLSEAEIKLLAEMK